MMSGFVASIALEGLSEHWGRRLGEAAGPISRLMSDQRATSMLTVISSSVRGTPRPGRIRKAVLTAESGTTRAPDNAGRHQAPAGYPGGFQLMHHRALRVQYRCTSYTLEGIRLAVPA